ncbi:V-type proton ATPase subunit S1-like [Mya arenaria]|uniref:V-type proton ATPase subunit S1-like n=1 Tax=Mya arenaria TaxID=6604 RepID=UPI0022E2ADC9|nr:V-type proton ATPase subunit S1-like [Mya arenaria]
MIPNVKMSQMLIFGVLFTFFMLVNTDKTPALIWSPNRPLSGLSPSYAGETIQADHFLDNYLTPLTTDPAQSLIVFVQNKLSVEDFTKHADVYNPNSDGGAFRNVKAAMDENFSVHLPEIASPTSAVQKLSTSFTGERVTVDSPTDLENMDLKPGTQYLIIISLKPISGKDEFSEFKMNDEDIGKCLHHLSRRGLQYSAVYTAEASQVSEEAVHSGRQLLAAEDAADNTTYNGTFYNVQNVLMYLQYVNLTITRKAIGAGKPRLETYQWNFKTPNITVEQCNDTINGSLDCVATPHGDYNALRINMTFDNSNGTANLRFTIKQTDNMGSQWKSTRGTVDLTPSSEGVTLTGMDVDYNIESIRGFCFHCARLYTKPSVRNFTSNATVYPSDVEKITLTMTRFQIEVSFNTSKGLGGRDFTNTSIPFSTDVWECVEFFTVPIWMGIISTLFLILILFYGLTMIANITTMDRFDDPKAKTITVTVNE